ncbi:HD domain-containing protein [Deinococcus radiotolerans]|uniref:HDIG domain-containing protein n=1 Tax=Deinococcus radiotolerans TaxID=1309407 RepID=A0ABQ2FHD3_9DEIO|nr:HD domain-containing protein [Deinococcus radiotolerans]GGK94647.1 HDIG domain-containing protein [Deinococcus radiotolerans]
MDRLHLWPEPLRAQPWMGDAGNLAALAEDVDTLLSACGREVTREHVPRVMTEARRLARHFGVPEGAAAQAALLHDLGGIVPRAEMVPLCEALGIPICPEERQMLLHAQLSVVLARERYGVTAAGMGQAIRYHTTLHAAPSALDLVVFLADKLEWDQGGPPPYQAALRRALRNGLEGGATWMLRWMASPEARLLVPHPDLRAAWATFGVTALV